MAEPTRYKEHLSTANHKKIKSTCNTYRAIEMANSSHPHLDVTGIGATACAHGCFVPTSVVDFQKGERQANMDYSLCQALNYNMDGIPIAVISYDIMCQYCVNLLKRIDENALLSIPEALKLRYVIVDGEIIETLWSILNNISRSTRGMSLVHRAEVLDAHMNYSNWKKLIKTVPFMLKRWKRVQEGLPLSEVAFVGLSQRFPTMIGIWALQEADAQSHRWENPEAMDIYETKTKKAPTRSEVQTELSKQEKAWDSSNGEAQWISSGLTIQETQLGIRRFIRAKKGRFNTADKKTLDDRRSNLQSLINKFQHEADSYLLRHTSVAISSIQKIKSYHEFDRADQVDEDQINESDRSDDEDVENEGDGLGASIMVPSHLLSKKQS
ncbi:hypothetical protein BC834DRAFT_976573 [Gloeopeniophorella convolvens]|nr:hypothetical protein BC834DRAFT_976573 [Gloeopeniophorella convolvens]